MRHSVRRVRGEGCDGVRAPDRAEFFVPAPTPTKGSGRGMGHRHTGRVIALPDNRKLGPWTKFASLIARAARPRDWDLAGPFEVTVRVGVQRPKDKRLARTRPFPTVKPDADKTARAILDLCTGIFWHDDAQVVDLGPARKRYCGEGVEFGARIAIRRLTEADL